MLIQVDRANVTLSICIGHSKAFDTVRHEQLLTKLDTSASGGFPIYCCIPISLDDEGVCVCGEGIYWSSDLNLVTG